MSNSNFVPDIEKPGWKFGYQKDIIDIIVNVHFNLYTSESMCCRAITFTFSILQSWQWEGQSGLKDIRQCETALMGEWCLSDVGWLPTCERLLTRFALAAFDDRWCQTHHLFAGESNHNRIFPFHVQPCQKSFCRLIVMLSVLKFHVRVKYQKIITMGWIIGQVETFAGKIHDQMQKIPFNWDGGITATKTASTDYPVFTAYSAFTAETVAYMPVWIDR